MYKQLVRLACNLACGACGPRRRRGSVLAIAVASLSGLSVVAVAEEVRVVATINPVHSLVSGVMAGVGQPHLIVRGSTSPHNFSMRPSDAQMLEDAHVVFLIGEGLETSLAASIDTLAAKARVVELAEIGGLVRKPVRAGGNFEADHEPAGHGKHGEGDDTDHDQGKDGLGEHGAGDHDDDHRDADAGHGDEAFDLHVWLDPANARAMVSVIAETLAEIDAANAPTYAANAANLHTRLSDLGTELAGMVESVRGRPFIVFHDAYRYFEDRFGLAAAGSAVVSADRSPGVRRIRELQGKVRDLSVMCVLAEPQFEPRLVSVIVEGTSAKAGSVDPLGATIESGGELYFTLMRNMAASFRDCLSG